MLSKNPFRKKRNPGRRQRLRQVQSIKKINLEKISIEKFRKRNIKI